MRQPMDVDILILGGGLVGLTAALCCAEKGLSVGVLEKNALELADLDTIDVRTSAITRASENIFKRLGVWELLPQDRISNYHRMVVWDGHGFGRIMFDAAEINADNLGVIIENKILLKALMMQVKQCHAITVLTQQSPKSVLIDENKALVTLNDATEITAKCLIGSDGSRSWLRDALSFDFATKDYQQTAIIATVHTEKPHENTAWQRFLPEGPLAFLPLFKPHECAIVWTVKTEKSTELLQHSSEDFCDVLAHHFDYQLGKINKVFNRQSFPLSALSVSSSVKPRVVLVGDAAHVVHPLAGQGVNLGIQNSDRLTEILAKTQLSGMDIGSFLALRRYERSANYHTKPLLWTIDALNTCFSQKSDWWMAVRSFGLNRVDNSTFLKRKLIRIATGI